MRVANLAGQTHLDHVTRLAAFDEAQDAAGDEAAHRPAHGVVRETNPASEPGNGKVELQLSFQASVTKEMRINSTVDKGEGQTRRKKVLQLFPHEFGVWFSGFHGQSKES
jgi:hypothetical protein